MATVKDGSNGSPPAGAVTSMFSSGFLAHLHAPGDNPQLHPHLKEAHLVATEGKVRTRFPPEPNGYLHIGHSKAIAVNFGYAKAHGGTCYLRYDDTNPEKEEERYFESIREMIEWLGFKPEAITYSSDHFQRLYNLAEQLIETGHGYVCHCTGEEIHASRGGDSGGARVPCAHRTRPSEESLAEFRKMKEGHYEPGQAILRMKQNLQDGNPQMWDLIAYRVVKARHHRTGDAWKIYPTYDFTHCLCDSFENISHSLCTTEFINSRVSYEWLCDALQVYKARQYEYGRLNLTGTVLSKRKIAQLVELGHVQGWDDPRLYTLVAIKRRGVPPGAILNFVNELGVTTAVTNIMTTRFENSVRKYLENSTPRLMMLLDPIKVTLTNLPPDFLLLCDVPFKPRSPEEGSHQLPFTAQVYIDRSDFREVDSKDYFRLAPGKAVGLLNVPCPIRCDNYKKDEHGQVIEIEATYLNSVPFKKPKTYIQWIGKSQEHHSPLPAHCRIYEQLFQSENPSAHKGGFLSDLNPDSLKDHPNAMIEIGLLDIQRRAEQSKIEQSRTNIEGNESVRFQALRIGYFCIDQQSSSTGSVTLNRIVSLREDTARKAVG